MTHAEPRTIRNHAHLVLWPLAVALLAVGTVTAEDVLLAWGIFSGVAAIGATLARNTRRAREVAQMAMELVDRDKQH